MCIWFHVTHLLNMYMKFTLLIGEILMYFRYMKYTRYVKNENSRVLLNSHGSQRREREYALQSKELFFK